MKTPRSEAEQRWEKLLEQARADVAPPVNTAALLSAVRREPRASPADWAAELSALFTFGRLVPGCLAGATLLTVFTAWQISEWWQAFPWAELFVNSTGGAL